MSTFCGAVYYEIPVTNLDRAVAFYSNLLSITLERGTIDGNSAAFFPVTPEAAGITGALMQGDSYTPSLNGSRIYLRSGAIDDLLRRVLALGGEVLYPRTSIGEFGFVAEFRDSEGNRIALHEPADQ